jgi:cell division control protein 11
MRRKNVRKGLAFTVMVAGASGLGKSTFINTLCGSNVHEGRQIPNAHEAASEKTPDIIAKYVGILILIKRD